MITLWSGIQVREFVVWNQANSDLKRVRRRRMVSQLENEIHFFQYKYVQDA